jgi:hypothetical protein
MAVSLEVDYTQYSGRDGEGHPEKGLRERVNWGGGVRGQGSGVRQVVKSLVICRQLNPRRTFSGSSFLNSKLKTDDVIPALWEPKTLFFTDT